MSDALPKGMLSVRPIRAIEADHSSPRRRLSFRSVGSSILTLILRNGVSGNNAARGTLQES